MALEMAAAMAPSETELAIAACARVLIVVAFGLLGTLGLT
jgi:hypothetical protein